MPLTRSCSTGSQHVGSAAGSAAGPDTRQSLADSAGTVSDDAWRALDEEEEEEDATNEANEAFVVQEEDEADEELTGQSAGGDCEQHRDSEQPELTEEHAGDHEEDQDGKDDTCADVSSHPSRRESAAGTAQDEQEQQSTGREQSIPLGNVDQRTLTADLARDSETDDFMPPLQEHADDVILENGSSPVHEIEMPLGPADGRASSVSMASSSSSEGPVQYASRLDAIKGAFITIIHEFEARVLCEKVSVRSISPFSRFLSASVSFSISILLFFFFLLLAPSLHARLLTSLSLSLFRSSASRSGLMAS